MYVELYTHNNGVNPTFIQDLCIKKEKILSYFLTCYITGNEGTDEHDVTIGGNERGI